MRIVRVFHLITLFFIAICFFSACRQDSPEVLQGESVSEDHAASEEVVTAASEALEEFVQPSVSLQFRPSDYASPHNPRLIAVYLQFLGSKATRLESENLEDKFISLLNAHMPDPFVLVRAKTMDKGQVAWGTLYLKFKRTNIRLKRVSKSIPQKNSFSFELELSFVPPPGFSSNWRKWTFSYSDSQPSEEYPRVNSQFWDALTAKLPTFVADTTENTQDWLIKNNFTTKLTTKAFKPLLSLPQHSYYPDGCLLLQDDKDRFAIQYLSNHLTPWKGNAYSKALSVDVPNIQSLFCTSNAIYSISIPSPRQVHLIYQPLDSPNVWKTVVPFSMPLGKNTVEFVFFKKNICLFNLDDARNSKFSQLFCYSIQTGLPTWSHSVSNSGFRGLGQYQDYLFLAMDQSLIMLDSGGGVKRSSKWRNQTYHKVDKPLFCQQNHRLIFAPKLGKFVSMDLDTLSMEWELHSFGGHFLHCDQHNAIYLDEAGGIIVSVDAESRKPRWKFHAGILPKDAISLGENLILLLKNAIYVLDAETGRVVAQIPLSFSAERFISYQHRLFLDASDAIYEMTKH